MVGTDRIPSLMASDILPIKPKMAPNVSAHVCACMNSEQVPRTNPAWLCEAGRNGNKILWCDVEKRSDEDEHKQSRQWLRCTRRNMISLPSLTCVNLHSVNSWKLINLYWTLIRTVFSAFCYGMHAFSILGRILSRVSSIYALWRVGAGLKLA